MKLTGVLYLLLNISNISYLKTTTTATTTCYDDLNKSGPNKTLKRKHLGVSAVSGVSGFAPDSVKTTHLAREIFLFVPLGSSSCPPPPPTRLPGADIASGAGKVTEHIAEPPEPPEPHAGLDPPASKQTRFRIGRRVPVGRPLRGASRCPSVGTAAA